MSVDSLSVGPELWALFGIIVASLGVIIAAMSFSWNMAMRISDFRFEISQRINDIDTRLTRLEVNSRDVPPANE